MKVSAISESGSQFSMPGLSLPLSLAAGQSVALKVAFSPSAAGWIGGRVTFTSTASNPSLDLVVGGVGVHSEPLNASPASVSFGQVTVGSQATVSVKVSNPHSWTETVSALQAAGLGFTVTGPSLPAKLGAGQSLTLSVSFTPKTAGVIGGRIFISGPAMAIPLTGTGSSTTSGSLTITPAQLSFGSVMLGETGMQTAVLSAVGTSVTISSAASSSGQFTLPGATFPVTIAAGQSVQVNVAFTPTTAGNASGKLSFSSNATDSQASEPVAGTGTAPQVSLAWSPSTSQVQGYNVYRGAAPGSYTKLNAGLDATTSFTDSTVKAGTSVLLRRNCRELQRAREHVLRAGGSSDSVGTSSVGGVLDAGCACGFCGGASLAGKVFLRSHLHNGQRRQCVDDPSVDGALKIGTNTRIVDPGSSHQSVMSSTKVFVVALPVSPPGRSLHHESRPTGLSGRGQSNPDPDKFLSLLGLQAD